jgi:hypothetical protein
MSPAVASFNACNLPYRFPRHSNIASKWKNNILLDFVITEARFVIQAKYHSPTRIKVCAFRYSLAEDGRMSTLSKPPVFRDTTFIPVRGCMIPWISRKIWKTPSCSYVLYRLSMGPFADGLLCILPVSQPEVLLPRESSVYPEPALLHLRMLSHLQMAPAQHAIERRAA